MVLCARVIPVVRSRVWGSSRKELCCRATSASDINWVERRIRYRRKILIESFEACQYHQKAFGRCWFDDCPFCFFLHHRLLPRVEPTRNPYFLFPPVLEGFYASLMIHGQVSEVYQIICQPGLHIQPYCVLCIESCGRRSVSDRQCPFLNPPSCARS